MNADIWLEFWAFQCFHQCDTLPSLICMWFDERIILHQCLLHYRDGLLLHDQGYNGSTFKTGVSEEKCSTKYMCYQQAGLYMLAWFSSFLWTNLSTEWWPGLPKASFGHGSAGCLMTIYDIVWVASSAAGRRCVVQNNTWMLFRIFPGILKILLLRRPGKILTLHGVSRIFGMAWWVHQLFHPTGHAPPGMMLLIVSMIHSDSSGPFLRHTHAGMEFGMVAVCWSLSSCMPFKSQGARMPFNLLG